MNPGLALAILAALVSGAFAALQAPTNSMLARAVNSPVNAALISFAVGTVALILVALGLGARPDAGAVRALPWYAWVGGLYGAFFVAAAAFATPRMGVTYFIAVLIGGQLLVALLLDHLGAFGLAREPINLSRVGGVLLILMGVLLVRR
jgi:bacterial/archaeal transporter family-2 protein